MINIGDMAWLPARFAHGGHTALIDGPGRVISIDDAGWAIVDRGRWGRIGVPAEDLVLAELPPVTHVLARAVRTCDACPSQWNAWTTTGQYLYLRYRSGVGSVDAYESPDWESWPHPPEGAVARFGEPSLDGVISLEDFCARAGLQLAPRLEPA